MQTGPPCPDDAQHAVSALTFAILAVGLLVLAAAVVVLRGRRRERSLRHLLDRADALEALLKTARERMGAMREVVQRVPADIAAVAHASLDAEPQVQQALRDVLEHRLWISKHGLTATQAELDRACAAMDRAYASIADQLARLENAGAELIDVTQAAVDQAAREPAALKRALDAGP